MERHIKVPAPIRRMLAWSFPQAGSTSTEPASPLLVNPPETAGWLSLSVGFVVCAAIGLNYVFQPSHDVAPLAAWGGTLLYFCGLAIMVLVRWTSDVRSMVLGFVAVLIVSVVLRFLLDGELGLILMEYLPVVVVYRLPVRRSLPLVGIDAGAYVVTALLRHLALGMAHDNAGSIVSNLVVMTLIVIGILTLRSRMVLILQLKSSQAQLRAEMAHTGELAAARERNRIARDMHDVLAHSLTVLSIQTRAARQLVTQQPERAVATLDEMAGVLRESIAESRRVVGLLREAAYVPTDDSSFGAQLLALAARFAERTGVNCALQERGTPHVLVAEQAITLQFALQEALTNAYRHGAAQHVWAELLWRQENVILTVRDDGTKQGVVVTESGGGNGLQGMRERAAALGGNVITGLPADGGFAITLTLPIMVGATTAARLEV